jgi:hypothetical protein
MLKPTPAFAIITRSSILYQWRWGVSFSYAPFHTTMDEFPIYSMSDNGYGTETMYPGTQTFSGNRYHLFYVIIAGEYKILKTPLSPIVGLDFRMHLSSYSFYTKTAIDGSSSENEHSATMAFLPRAGLVYDLEDAGYTFMLTAGYNWDVVPKKTFPYLDVSLAVLYYFDD